ncbi:hypothetical protein JCM10021v2_004558 [Rhodotorula toruloides]
MPTATARASVFYGLSIFAADLCAAAHAWRDIRAAVRVFDQVLLGLPFKRLVPARASLADLPETSWTACWVKITTKPGTALFTTSKTDLSRRITSTVTMGALTHSS